METDSKRRFSNRVEAYVKYRPSYPQAMIDFFRTELSLSSSSTIADIGSGTGILAELFLKNGNIVFAVEPNREMREAAEKLLDRYPNFRSVEGTAEETTLQANSIDFVTAGQAFHWFDLQKSRAEFSRILKPQGRVILIWNDRRMNNPFLSTYENLLKKFGTDYQKIDHRNVNEQVLAQFFDSSGFAAQRFDYLQTFDLEGLKGRLLSASYVPMKGQPNYEAMIEELEGLYAKFTVEGRVVLEYDTKVYYGTVSPTGGF